MPTGSPDHLVLRDGRRLDYRLSRRVEDAAGVLVFHHGTPGACTPIRALERAAHARGLSVLTTSRPGYGHSSRQPGRTVADVVADTAAVLAHLGVGGSLVCGWSGGGPHALACAARLSGVRGALVISGVGPYGAEDLDFLAGMGEQNVVEFGNALAGERSLRAFLDDEAVQLQRVHPDDIVSSMTSLLPPVDVAVLTGEFAEDIADGFHEGLESGVDGWLDDDLAFTRPWSFELSEIAVPTQVWQGGDDLMVPIAHGEWLARNVPGVTAHLEQGEGHLSIGLGALNRMIDELLTQT